MTSDLQAIQYAGQLIELARGEETASGNPLAASRHYITAMETIVSTAYKHAAATSDLSSRRAFLSQVRSRVELYYDRAELLLQVAAEMGLLDKPGQGGGMRAALPGPNAPQMMPPTLFGLEGADCGGGRASSGGGSPAVMGIPLPPLQQQQGGVGDAEDMAGDTPGINYYIRPSDSGSSGSAAPPPPPEFNLDDLMRELGAPKDP